LLRLEGRAVSRVVLSDESGRPNAVTMGELRHRSDDLRWRSVMNFCAQIRPMSVPKAREWRMYGADFQVHAAPL
jgi:hypothetical protein